jgi:dihydrolipoamide dehydrogenase
MGSVWSRLGTKVTVVEYTSDILPNVDKEIAKNCQKIFEKRGMNFKLETKLVKAQKNEHDKVDVLLENAKNSAQEPWEVDVVLLAVGRKPYTEGLNLDKLGVNRTSRGQIEVDRHFQTSVNGIYAIGDVIVGPMLAHKAEEEGVAIAEILAGQAGHVNYDLIPGVIYTSPEVATIGKNEQELQARNIPYNTGKFPLTANSRAKAIGHTDGMVKVITCKETDRILGVHIIGPDAGTLIAEVVIAMEYGASAEDIARTCHAHPTLNEAVKEAALAAFVKAIHL